MQTAFYAHVVLYKHTERSVSNVTMGGINKYQKYLHTNFQICTHIRNIKIRNSCKGLIIFSLKTKCMTTGNLKTSSYGSILTERRDKNHKKKNILDVTI
jgi:hypothetical protein